MTLKPDADMTRGEAVESLVGSIGKAGNLIVRISELCEVFADKARNGKCPVETASEFQEFTEELEKLIDQFEGPA